MERLVAGTRKSSRLRREIADTVFRLCCVGGILLGVLAAVDHVRAPATAKCADSGRCVGEAITSAMTPLLATIGVGLAIGAVVGLALALAIKRSAR